mmetsp:Transcript_47212/g.60673  ORF Transcript_47212/g.60673 Transcript_47212/m.60673 type:complete len:421 (+) Transcript_47212:15-1277(+)
MASCGPLAIGVFTVALIGGTASTLLSKVMFGFYTLDSDGVEMKFQRPLMQTFLMFVAMTMALPIYYGYLFFAGHQFPKVKRKMWFILAAPACTDMLGTMFMMIGLLYVSVSVYQLVRCLVIVYVALLRRFALKAPTENYQWAGVIMNATSVCIVSAAALFDPAQQDVLLGISFINFGCFIMACQLTLEEYVMRDSDEDEEGTPPLVVVGMEGFWGSFIMMTVIYPITYMMPGDDHGSYENFYESWCGLLNNPDLLKCAIGYVVAITTYNVSAIFITQLLEAVWRSILENFRPIAVWGTDLALFYMVTNGAFGEAWLGDASWLQIFGLVMLLSGTATYNGSLKWPCFKYPYVKGGAHTMTPGMDRIMSSPAVLRGTPGRGPYRPVEVNLELGQKPSSRTTDDFPQAQNAGAYGSINPLQKE